MPTPKVRDLVFSQWWGERVEYAPEAWTSLADLMADYSHAHSGAPMGRQAFVTQLNARKAHVRKRDGVYGVAGVRVVRAGFIVCDEVSEYHDGSFVEPADAAPDVARGSNVVLRGKASYGKTDAPLAFHRHPDAINDIEPRTAPLVWDLRLSPFVGGPAVMSVALDCPDEEDQPSARIAGEFYLARRKQRVVHGYTHADDDGLAPGELASMASAYAFGASVPPKYAGWFRVRKPGEGREPEEYPLLHLMRQLWRRSMETFRYGAPRELLVRAGGLLIAAIETLDRKAARQAKEEERANG